jgi:hypothetical protein
VDDGHPTTDIFELGLQVVQILLEPPQFVIQRPQRTRIK